MTYPGRKQVFRYSTPKGEYLRDKIALSGKDIKDPQQGFNELQQPDVEFRFTDAGKTAFHNVTREISQRGTELRLPGVDPRAAVEERIARGVGRLALPVTAFMPDLETTLARFGEEIIKPYANA